MSDDEAGPRKGQYKIEYSNSGRAMCKGPKPCKGSKLEKGVLRLGVVSDFRGHVSWSYRHYGCITSKVFQNMKHAYSSAEEVEGFDTLSSEDQKKFKTAWDKEQVEPEDVPATAVAGADDEEEAATTSKKKPGRPRKKQKTDDDDEDDAPKPKKKAAPRRKKKADSDEDAELSLSDDDAGSDYGSGKKRKRGGGKKSPKKRAADDDDY